MQRRSWWLVARGLAVLLLLTLFLLRVATPRTYVIPGDRVGPPGAAKAGKEATPAFGEAAGRQSRPE
jgi:hypothetical protein